MVHKITISDFKAFEKNTLRGFFTATLEDGLIIHNLSLHEKNGGRWIGMPSEKFTDREGRAGYKKLVEFTDRAALDAFRDACLDAIDALGQQASQPSRSSSTSTAPPSSTSRSSRPSRSSSSPSSERAERPVITDEDIPF